MRVLFFGAGALGTLFAAKLAAAGHDVSVLARGERLAAIERDGLRIRPRAKGEAPEVRPAVVSRVRHDVPYDLVVVLVRRNQVDEALRTIAAEHDGDVLVMVNEGAECGGSRRGQEADPPSIQPHEERQRRTYPTPSRCSAPRRASAREAPRATRRAAATAVRLTHTAVFELRDPRESRGVGLRSGHRRKLRATGATSPIAPGRQ